MDAAQQPFLAVAFDTLWISACAVSSILHPAVVLSGLKARPSHRVTVLGLLIADASLVAAPAALLILFLRSVIHFRVPLPRSAAALLLELTMIASHASLLFLLATAVVQLILIGGRKTTLSDRVTDEQAINVIRFLVAGACAVIFACFDGRSFDPLFLRLLTTGGTGVEDGEDADERVPLRPVLAGAALVSHLILRVVLRVMKAGDDSAPTNNSGGGGASKVAGGVVTLVVASALAVYVVTAHNYSSVRERASFFLATGFTCFLIPHLIGRHADGGGGALGRLLFRTWRTLARVHPA